MRHRKKTKERIRTERDVAAGVFAVVMTALMLWIFLDEEMPGLTLVLALIAFWLCYLQMAALLSDDETKGES